MLKIGTPVRYEGGEGKIDRTSTRTGTKLYRVSNHWFPKEALERV